MIACFAIRDLVARKARGGLNVEGSRLTVI